MATMFSAEGFHIHCYPVTWFHMGYISPTFSTMPTISCPMVIPGTERGNATMLDVEIAGTDTAQSNLHDGIMCIQYNRLFLFCEAKFTLSYICICLHLIISNLNFFPLFFLPYQFLLHDYIRQCAKLAIHICPMNG